MHHHENTSSRSKRQAPPPNERRLLTRSLHLTHALHLQGQLLLHFLLLCPRGGQLPRPSHEDDHEAHGLDAGTAVADASARRNAHVLEKLEVGLVAVIMSC